MSILRPNLRTRIYLSMMAIILMSFLVTGATAYYNYKQQNEDYHNNRLHRKEEAVTRSLDYFLEQQGGYLNPDSITQAFSDKICELSDIHSMPINLFNLRGDLIISSNPNLFEEKGIPEQIDYTILKQLSTGNNRAVITENDGNRDYLLAYWYFKDQDNRPIAINSVTYFETEVINQKELTDFLWRLTQLYIALFIGASLLAFFLSNYITKSLQAISERFKSVNLGQRNDPIIWKSDDEIGALVKEYNRMLHEAELSAEKLARSERESAWREMAKQVAHEIKNPLTPIKLRVQHLQQAWKDQAPDFDEKLKRVSESIIEQIDALSNIATEFSNFAKMPKANKEPMDLRQSILSAVELFRESQGVSVVFHNTIEGSTPIRGDKEQLLRAFNNLIKNAVQAIPEEKEGLVSITLIETGDNWQLAVQDNGVGIPDHQRDRIFVPNFTTKSTGTGLGLAMVKNIIEQHHGQVWFESEEGKGSTFFIRMPKVEKLNSQDK